jgi:hypothetical protein
MAVNPDVSTWSKLRQYAWSLSILWGKMVTTVDAQILAGRCPDIRAKTGLICPIFNEADVAQIVKMYMSIYPEHRGFEDRLRWIIRCIFSGGQVPATPPGVLTLAPYLQKRQFPGVTPAPSPVPVTPPAPPPGAEISEGIPNWAIYAGLGVLAYYVLIRR